MSETLKTQLIYEIAEELIKKFDVDVSKEILNIINKHLYNYDVIKKLAKSYDYQYILNMNYTTLNFEHNVH